MKIIKKMLKIWLEVLPASDSTLKVCNFVDKIHKEDNYIIWSYVKKDDNKNILLSFLRELAFKKLVPTLDKIFIS